MYILGKIAKCLCISTFIFAKSRRASEAQRPLPFYYSRFHGAVERLPAGPMPCLKLGSMYLYQPNSLKHCFCLGTHIHQH